MTMAPISFDKVSAIHSWLKDLHLSFVPGPVSPILKTASEQLLTSFRMLGHSVQPEPTDETDLIFTTAEIHNPLNWRRSLFFNARRRFKLSSQPTICTLIHLTPIEFQRHMEHFAKALRKDEPDPEDFDFSGLADNAYLTLFEQGRRGGPILALQRMLQAQSKCLRIILFVGDELPEAAYSFDLVGAYPRTDGADPESMYVELALRLVTALSSGDVTDHEIEEVPIDISLWRRLPSPKAMQVAAQQFNQRDFFTNMVRVADLVEVPVMSEAIASQYSEGCFATWEPELQALITTVTGSLRPVMKGRISTTDLAVVVGVRPEGNGAKVRLVEGLENNRPSSEAVEMYAIDTVLPHIQIKSQKNPPESDGPNELEVPVARSKLHGHRGVSSYDPDHVEFVPLEEEYHQFPVSCGSRAQATAVTRAFGRSEALQNPDDSRNVIFTILPGHGLFIVEKWLPGKRPFEIIWEHMDDHHLQIDPFVPQGKFSYAPSADGLLYLQLD